MKYDFKCQNPDCYEFGVTITKDIPLKEYKIPNCEYCSKPTERVFSSVSVKTNDGFKH